MTTLAQLTFCFLFILMYRVNKNLNALISLIIKKKQVSRNQEIKYHNNWEKIKSKKIILFNNSQAIDFCWNWIIVFRLVYSLRNALIECNILNLSSLQHYEEEHLIYFIYPSLLSIKLKLKNQIEIKSQILGSGYFQNTLNEYYITSL